MPALHTSVAICSYVARDSASSYLSTTMVTRAYYLRLLVAALLHMHAGSAFVVVPSLRNGAYRRTLPRFISAALERPNISEDDPRFCVEPSLTLPEVRFCVLFEASPRSDYY